MNAFKIIQKIVLVIIVTISLSPNYSYSQIINNGGLVTVSKNAILYAQSVTNSSGGLIVNNGVTIANSDIINDSSATLSGDGTYSIKGSFLNTGTYNPGLSVLNFFGIGNSALQNKSGTVYAIQVSKAPNWIIDMLDSETITGSISFGLDSTWIRLNNSNLTLDTGCNLYDYGTTMYFVTNGSGSLKKKKVNKAPFQFPVGYDPSHYNPLTITENGTADDYSVQCLEHALLKGSSGNPISSGGIDAGWIVKEAIPGGANASINAAWNISDELPGFDNTHAMLTRYNGTKWDYQANKAGVATGSLYRSISRTGLLNLGYFTVLSRQNPSFTGEVTALERDAPAAIKVVSAVVRVYPTLVQNDITIDVRNNDNTTGKMNISVIDQTGRTVLQKQNAMFQSQKLVLSNLLSGMYTVVISYGTNRYSQKIIISR